MIEDKDYIMRLTHEIVRTLIRLLFQKDIDKDEEAAISAEMAVRYRELLSMIRDGQINEAENLLLDEMEPDNPAWFEMALLFYEKLGAQPEEFLEAHAYTQDEVVDGLRYVVDTCGYGDLWDTISR